MRYIELYNYGEIKYFSIEKTGTKTYRKSKYLGAGDEVKLVQKTMHIKCIKKGQTYYLIEPTTKYVNYSIEEKHGNNCFIADWIKKT